MDIFMHIPKTGGSTLARTLKYIYGSASVCVIPSGGAEATSVEPELIIERLPNAIGRECRLIRGHCIYGLHEYIDEPCRYFTLLREPLRRVVSHYFYHRARYGDSLSRYRLEEFLESSHPMAKANRQVLFLSGIDPDKRPQEALEVAKERLRNDLSVFGLTERFSESMILFQKRLGWRKTPYYVRRKVNKGRPRLEDLAIEVVDAVIDHNRLDVELYRCAEIQFDKSLREEEVGRVSCFRVRNRLVQLAVSPVIKSYRLIRKQHGKKRVGLDHS